jgi:D-amino-acid dehydrogenase
VTGEVVDFERSGNQVTAVKLADGRRIPVRGVVVAAGAWSRTLCERLGDRVPLESERGYHVMLPNSGVKLRRSLTIPSRGFGIVPMQAGLCIAGTVELARLGAPPNYARADRLVEKARAIFPHLNPEGATRWMGNRPAMPDSIPVIDRGKVENAFYAFGHGHRGMSFAATTGRLIAGLVTKQRLNFDLRPFSLGRF